MSELVWSVVVVQVVSCLCSLFEAVLYSTPASHIELMCQQGHRSGPVLKRLKADIQTPIAVILSLNTLANTGGAAVAGAAFASAFPGTSETCFTLGLSLSVLVFSEILPKTAGVAYARRLAPFIATPLLWMGYLLAPLIWLNRGVARLIMRRPGAPTSIGAEEIEVIARLSRQAGEIGPDQERVIANILHLDTLRARDIMTPRTVVFALDRSLTLAQARQEAGRWPHSRVPLCAGDRDTIVGLVLRRDVFNALADGADHLLLADLERPLHMVPETARANQLLQEFLAQRQHLFGVVDEYGVFAGIVTLEDVLEEIVGAEIVGEFDPAVDMRERARRHRQRLAPDAESDGA